MIENGKVTAKAGEALDAYDRVKIESGTTNDPPEVVKAGAGEVGIGFTEMAYADGDNVSIKLINHPGLAYARAADTFSHGAVLYGAADGEVSDTPNGPPIGFAWEDATAANDVVTILVTAIEGASAQRVLALNDFTFEDGTAIDKVGTATAGWAQLSNKERVFQIPVNASAGEAIHCSAPIPNDLDPAQDITVRVPVWKSADADSLTLDVEVYPVPLDGSTVADICDTAATSITSGTTPGEMSFTCGAATILAAPGYLSVVMALGGTNDGDIVYVGHPWIEYYTKGLAA